MIALTGAGGFIGSVVLGYLNRIGINDIVLFDDIPVDEQYKNLIGKRFISLHSTDEMFEYVDNVNAVIHLGANSNTLEKDWKSIYQTNVLSTRMWNDFCKKGNIPFIFSSSAAIYGNGNGPMNHYAFSKMLSENEIEGVALRLFNVYGPNEYHKFRMASTVFHWYHQLKQTGKIELFENSDTYFRDFIYVEDVAKIIAHFLNNRYVPGIYDVGTGSSVSFEFLADKLIELSGNGEKQYIKMPQDLQKQYQRNTRANVEELRKIGIDIESITPADQGVRRYFDYLDSDQMYY